MPQSPWAAAQHEWAPSEGQPHPSQPGNPRGGIQPAFLCWNRGKLCSSSPLTLPPPPTRGRRGGGWEKGEWERQLSKASAQLPGAAPWVVSPTRHFLGILPGTSQPLQSPFSPPLAVPRKKDIVEMEEERGVKAQLPKKAA